MRLSKKNIVYVAILAVVAAVTALYLTGGGESNNPKNQQTGQHRKKSKPARLISTGNEPSVARMKIDAAQVALTNRNGNVIHKVRINTKGEIEDDWVDENGKPWPKDQLELMRAIYNAGQEEDYPALVSELDAVLKCPNPEIREKFVDELGWHGERALSDLTYFLSDPNEDVVDSARTHLIDAVQELDDDAEKAAVVTTLSRAVSDGDMLESLADELMAMDELLALQTICDVIDTGTPKAANAVKEMYETITDQPWSGVDDAEAWLLENYEGAKDIVEGYERSEEVRQ